MTPFRFQQFSVRQSQCGMKLGLESVLLGAMARFGSPNRVLDIGTGCGILALMAAQRTTAAEIIGIEIDGSAAAEASNNFAESPWNERLSITHQSLQEFASLETGLFDSVICNPPWYDGTPPVHPSRRLARNSESLSLESLLAGAGKLLSAKGQITVLLPTAELAKLRRLTESESEPLKPGRSVLIQSLPNRRPKRAIVELSRDPTSHLEETILVATEQHRYTSEFREITKAFYLPETFRHTAKPGQ